MYLTKKPRLSPSIPKNLLNFKGKKMKGSSKDYESVGKAESAGTSDEWTDFDVTGSSKDYETVEKAESAGSSSDYSPVEQARFADSFEFDFGASLAASTSCSSKSSFDIDGRESSSDYSPVEQARFADSFEFNFRPPLAASTPNSSFAKYGREVLPVGETYWRSSEKSSEKESCNSSSTTLKEPESSFVEDKRNLDDFVCLPFKEPFTSASPLYKRASFLKQNNDLLLEAETNRSDYERTFKKESSKSFCATQKEMHPAKILERYPKFKKRKQLYSEFLPVDKNPKRSKDTSKQVFEEEPTKRVLSREGDICPLEMDSVPGPMRSLPPPCFGGDVPIAPGKSKKMRTKRPRVNKSREKVI